MWPEPQARSRYATALRRVRAQEPTAPYPVKPFNRQSQVSGSGSLRRCHGGTSVGKVLANVTTLKKRVVILLFLTYDSGVPRERNGQREIRRLERAWLALLLFLLGVALVSVVRGEQSAVFAHYNLENYIVMDRRENGQLVHSPKPEKEIEPLLRIIREIHPDLLGVAEMGSPGQFESFRQRLAQEGITFVDAEYVSGPDPDRHIALLSRFSDYISPIGFQSR